MQTLLGRFCDEFVRITEPLTEPLAAAARAAAADRDHDGIAGVRGRLEDLGRRIELLAGKIVEQQSYVLIFGPLKSGKSTLMNALCASYVSEVTSLPAYPCTVFVRHDEDTRYVVRHYDGTEVEFTDGAAMRAFVDEAHAELAARIREAEEAAEEFEPETHFPGAIRRVDVSLPAGHLASSGAMLVDTPGLYSRMKIGYDRMTRDFQHTAACAVFVVRSDNLFLEQAFAEFERLLEVFSRVFLVVNLDSQKRDLAPDGALIPSIEHTEPQRIIAAFEDLAMSATLRRAVADGRLRLFPIDLLQAAGARLRGKPADEESKAAADGFAQLLDELFAYLDSTDYVIAFLGDTLRHARGLFDECAAIGGHRAVASLRDRTERAEAEVAAIDATIGGLDAVAGQSWADAAAPLTAELGGITAKASKSLEAGVAKQAGEAIAAWFRTDDSLQHLVDHDLRPAFADYQRRLAGAVSAELRARLEAGAVLDVAADVAVALARAEIDLGAVVAAAGRAIDCGKLVTASPEPLTATRIPVTRGLWDRLLFRSEQSVRDRLLGPASRPTLAVPRARKADRLGKPAELAIRRQVEAAQSALFADSVKRLTRAVGAAFVDAVRRAVELAVEQRCSAAADRREHLAAAVAAAAEVLGPVRAVAAAATAARSEVEALAAHYAELDLFLLTKPVRGEHELPRPQRKPGAAPDPATMAPRPRPAERGVDQSDG